MPPRDNGGARGTGRNRGTRAVALVRRALRQFAARSNLLDPGRRVVVAFSGGQDSTALLHAVVAHGATRQLHVIAAHVDHGIRQASQTEALRAMDLARSLGADEVVVRRVSVPRYREGRRWTVQQAARQARYHALASVVAETGADALFVAHTADDQAETVLLNLVRGAGLAGIAAMRLVDDLDASRLGPAPQEAVDWGPARVCTVARPLLRVERQITLAYCREVGLPLIDDGSNASRAYTRNRVRSDLLPLLERFNPSIRSVLARTADQAAEDLDALNVWAALVHDSLAQPIGSHALRYDLAAWRAHPRGLQRRVLRHGIQILSGGLEDVAAAPVEDALDLLATTAGRPLYFLPRGIELQIERAHLTLRLGNGSPTHES